MIRVRRSCRPGETMRRMTATIGTTRAAGGAMFALASLSLAAAAAAAATTPAGTRIANTARLSTAAGAVSSNTVTLAVNEMLDVTIAAAVRATDVPADDAVVAVAFDVANAGNADGAFAIGASVDDATVAIAGIAADGDGDGRYDPAVDAALSPASLTVASGARRRIFVLVRGAGRAPRDVTVTATATAAKGHGAAGLVLAGAGTDGVDAIVGTNGASASAATLLVPAVAGPRLDKSQSVVAPDGSSRVMPGTIVTYRLEARFPAATAAAEVSDAIPAGTRFVPGSVTLDGRVMTDATDGDAARFDGAAIHVALGDIAAAATCTIQFKAVIQ
jgi:uncharacterized repeat protein (TIGR01451 family)